MYPNLKRYKDLPEICPCDEVWIVIRTGVRIRSKQLGCDMQKPFENDYIRITKRRMN